jgi:transposase-like protein
MNEKQAGAMARRRSRAEVDELVAEYETAGLSRQEFCRQHGLAVGTLDRYRRRRQAPAKKASGSRWVAVEVSGAKRMDSSEPGVVLAVVLTNGRRIEVKRGFDTNLLAQLLPLLEQA